MNYAFLFPGQGSQTPGMGREAYEAFASAREVFDRVDEALSEHLSKIIFEGPADLLKETRIAQPALMTVSLALVAVLEKEGNFSLQRKGSLGAGHSLGEYTALAAAQAFSLEEAARLLRARGEAMGSAVPKGTGGMLAILGLNTPAVELVVEKASAYGICAISNENCPGQTVVSGETSALAEVEILAKSAGAKRVIPLEVSAPFHCVLMAPAQAIVKEALAHVTFCAPTIPVVSNVTATPEREVKRITALLVDQVTHCVRWTDCVRTLETQDVDHCVEIGSGRVLSGLVRRISPSMKISVLNTPDDIEIFLKENT